MSTPSTLMATGTGEIVFTFWIGANFVSSSRVKSGSGRAAIVYLEFLHSSSFNCANVNSGRVFCSAERSKCMEMSVSVQSGAGASNVVSTCFSPQVMTTGREGPPASATEITLT